MGFFSSAITRSLTHLTNLAISCATQPQKHWVTVPVSACNRTPRQILESPCLAVSSHFHLIQFWNGSCDDDLLSVHTYSSESGVWSHCQTDWNDYGQLKGYGLTYGYGHRTFVNGILHLMVSNLGRDQIVAVDVHGRIKRTIKMPAAAQGRCSSYIGQSQGRLHYINVDFDAHAYKVSIWVLEDFDTQEWVLKNIVSSLSLFGRIAAWESKHWETDYDFVVIHPDRNVVFFVGTKGTDSL